MTGAGNVDEKKEKESFLRSGFGQFIFVLVLVCAGAAVAGLIARKFDTPCSLAENTIGCLSNLEDKINGKIEIIKRGGFSDSASYKEAEEIKAELESVRDKLVGVKLKLENRPWAN